jgi:hypothetical protein
MIVKKNMSERKRERAKNFVLRFLLIILLGQNFISCRGNSSSQENTSTKSTNSEIVEIFPPNGKGVFPEELTIYVVLRTQPSIYDVRFAVWKEGKQVAGTINISKSGDFWKVSFEPIQKEEGSYIAYFNYGLQATFWTFFAEITRQTPEFEKVQFPPDDEKNFPVEGTIFVSFEKLINPFSVDEDTVNLIKRGVAGEENIPADISYYPNYIIISSGKRESSSNYKVSITGIVPLFSGNPSFSVLDDSLRFRTVDIEKPYITSCLPNFCSMNSSCAVVQGSISQIEIDFNENEEIDVQSVIENIQFYLNTISAKNQKMKFKRIYKYFDKLELIYQDQSIYTPEWELYIYPNRVFVNLKEAISSPSEIAIYILPQFQDSSGNKINEFISWCITVE